MACRHIDFSISVIEIYIYFALLLRELKFNLSFWCWFSLPSVGTEEPDAKSCMWIIIGASVGGVVVFVIVVIIVCRW